MNHIRNFRFGNFLRSARYFGAGIALGVVAATPAFAAMSDEALSLRGIEPLSLRGIILAVSLGLLGLGLALKARAIRQERDVAIPDDTPDLRWWKNQWPAAPESRA